MSRSALIIPPRRLLLLLAGLTAALTACGKSTTAPTPAPPSALVGVWRGGGFTVTVHPDLTWDGGGEMSWSCTCPAPATCVYDAQAGGSVGLGGSYWIDSSKHDATGDVRLYGTWDARGTTLTGGISGSTSCGGNSATFVMRKQG